MNKTLIRLRKIGFDVDSSLNRFVNDENFYLSCIKLGLNEKDFDYLKVNLLNHNKKEAFENAHSLKGILANIGAIPLYNIIILIVEPLRNNDDSNLLPLYNQLIDKRNEILKLLK